MSDLYRSASCCFFMCITQVYHDARSTVCEVISLSRLWQTELLYLKRMWSHRYYTNICALSVDFWALSIYTALPGGFENFWICFTVNGSSIPSWTGLLTNSGRRSDVVRLPAAFAERLDDTLLITEKWWTFRTAGVLYGDCFVWDEVVDMFCGGDHLHCLFYKILC